MGRPVMLITECSSWNCWSRQYFIH